MTNIKEISLSTGKWLAVEVNKNAYDFRQADWGIIYQLPPLRGFLNIELPDGKYTFIGKADSLTEEQWKEIVERKEDGYECYDILVYGAEYSPMKTATESGLSLLRANGLNPDTCVIIQQQ